MELLEVQTSRYEATDRDIWNVTRSVWESNRLRNINEKQDELKTMNNAEFLQLPFSQRLQYINTAYVDSRQIASGEIKNLEFTFTFDGVYNKELFSRTTAGQVLPHEVSQVMSEWVLYTRTSLQWEFFSQNYTRLTIHEWTQLDILELRSTEHIKEQIAEFESQAADIYEVWSTRYNIIVSALKSGISPIIAIDLFESQLDEISTEGQWAKLEDLITEFDRLRGGIWSETENGDGTYTDIFMIILLKQFQPWEWQEKAEEYDLDKKLVEEFSLQRNIALYLSPLERINIVKRAPEDLKRLVKKYFPPEEYENALLVAAGESWFKYDAVNQNTDKYRSVDRWYFQINHHYHADRYVWEDIFDPEVNVRVAYEVFKERNNTWNPWYAARKIWLWI